MTSYGQRHANYYQCNKEIIRKKNHLRYIHRTYGVPMDQCEKLDEEIMSNAKLYFKKMKLFGNNFNFYSDELKNTRIENKHCASPSATSGPPIVHLLRSACMHLQTNFA